MDNDAVSRRYQSELRKRLSSQGAMYQGLKRPHQLRALYACTAHQYFDVGDTALPFFTQRVLGHTHIKEADVYNTLQVSVDAAARSSCGSFVV